MIILQLRKPEKFLLIVVKKESRIVIADRNINCELITNFLLLKAGFRLNTGSGYAPC